MSALIAVGGVLVGAGATVALMRRRQTPRAFGSSAALGTGAGPIEELDLATLQTAAEEPAPDNAGAIVWQRALALTEHAFREPLSKLRRSESPEPEAVEALERLARQLRLLASRPRPMQAVPVSPIALLEEAAEEVAPLRLGKVPASWSLRNRQPVHVDPDRSRAAFEELLRAAADATGEGGRLGIKILPGEDPRFPVRIEIEIGRRGGSPDALAMLVARRVLESQGARVEEEGLLTRVSLRSAPAEPPQIPSNK